MTGTWQDFLGLQALSGFNKLVGQMLLRNELGGVSNGYELVHATIGDSGYSFGGNQLDLGGNPHARSALRVSQLCGEE